jgi:sporulation protein YlmC with PRC-barrel domain
MQIVFHCKGNPEFIVKNSVSSKDAIDMVDKIIERGYILHRYTVTSNLVGFGERKKTVIVPWHHVSKVTFEETFNK